MIDLTPILLALIAGIFGIATTVIPLVINSRMKDKQAAVVLEAAVTSSLGAMQQAAYNTVTLMKPQIKIPEISPQFQIGLQYVLDHAGDEAARFGLSQADIVDKINARIGLAKIADPAVVTVLPVAAPTDK